MNHGFSRTNLALVSVTCATLWGCGAEGDHLDNATGDDPSAVDSIAAPLNSAPVYVFTNPPNPSDCTRFTNLLDGATKEAAENLRNPLMDTCLQNAVLTYTDSYPEAILARMREPRALHLWCQETLETDITDGVPYDAIAAGNLSPSGLGLKWRNSTLSSLSGRTFQQNAAVILHEVAHNWGHAHPNGNQSSPSLNFTQAFDYQHSVPRNVEDCGFNARDGRVVPVNNLRRDRMPNETTLAPFGRLAQGSAFERRCAFGVGFHFRSGNFVDAIDLACLSLNPGGPPQQPNYAGGTGGGPRSSLCNGNELLVGMAGFVDDNQVNQGFAACLPISSVQARTRTGFRFAGTAAGLPGGLFFSRECPAGSFVSAIRGMAAPFVHRLELECMDIGSVRTVSETPIPQGWVGGSGGSLRIEKCIGRGAMVGLTHQSGAIVDRLGGMCDTISTTCSGGTCTDRLTTFTPRVLPGHGGMGGGVAESRCPGNAALVGILGSTGPGMGLPNLLQWGMAICADVAGWSNVSAPQPTLTFGPQFGTGGAFNFARVCPRGSFINGWRIRAGAFVDGLEPICRDFN